MVERGEEAVDKGTESELLKHQHKYRPVDPPYCTPLDEHSKNVGANCKKLVLFAVGQPEFMLETLLVSFERSAL